MSVSTAPLAAACAVAIVCTACGAAKNGAPSVSRVELSDFSLVAPGLTFELHPTTAPILVQAEAEAPLKVCQPRTFFPYRWRGGCRALTDSGVSLPATNGLSHVVVRITTASGGMSRVRKLELRWHCVDHALGVFRGGTPAPVAHAVFDC